MRVLLVLLLAGCGVDLGCEERGMVQCGHICVDTQYDPEHCGGCGQACITQSDPASALCCGGQCMSGGGCI